MSSIDEMPDLNTDDPAIATLVSRLGDLEQQVEAKEKKKRTRASGTSSKSVPRMTLDEQFVYDLALTEVDVPGGRRRDAIADGYAKTYDLLMSRVGTELEEYVKQNGFTLQLLMATMKVYYSKEGRIVRGEQPRAKGEPPAPQPQTPPTATPPPETAPTPSTLDPLPAAEQHSDEEVEALFASDLLSDDVFAAFMSDED